MSRRRVCSRVDVFQHESSRYVVEACCRAWGDIFWRLANRILSRWWSGTSIRSTFLGRRLEMWCRSLDACRRFVEILHIRVTWLSWTRFQRFFAMTEPGLLDGLSRIHHSWRYVAKKLTWSSRSVSKRHADASLFWFAGWLPLTWSLAEFFVPSPPAPACSGSVDVCLLDLVDHCWWLLLTLAACWS